MMFGAPLLGLAALASWLPILWLHRRRREAPTVMVPALAPWLALVAPPVPRRRRIKSSWLLVLHLAIASALAAAVARPAIAGGRAPGGALALVIDTTTSMGAAGRWPATRDRAADLIDGARGPFTIVAAGPRPWLVAARAPAAVARAALAPLRPLGSGGDLGAAAALARAAAGGAARLVVVTDGGADGALDAAVTILIVADPEGGEANAAVLDAAAAHDPERGETRVTARVANFASRERRVEVSLEVDGQPADRRVLSLGAREVRTLAWHTRADARRAEVRLGGEDDLGADDVAHLWLPGSPLAVQMVGESVPIARALAASADIALQRAGPATLHADGSIDVTVVARTTLGRLPPGGVLWVLPPAMEGAETAPAASGRIAAVGDHPLAAGLDLADATLGGLTVTRTPRWAEPVLLAGDRVAAYAGFHDGRRHVVLAFDPAAGDVAARVGFPLLVARVVRWLGEPTHVGGAVTLGARVALAAPAEIERPDGERVRASESVTIDVPGLYRIERGDGPPSVLAANAGDARESDLALRVVAAREGRSGDSGGAPGRPLWRIFALLAVLLAAVEAAWRGAPPGRGMRRGSR